jgi:hypothetical protein
VFIAKMKEQRRIPGADRFCLAVENGFSGCEGARAQSKGIEQESDAGQNARCGEGGALPLSQARAQTDNHSTN